MATNSSDSSQVRATSPDASCLVVQDPPSGLLAVIVIDDMTLGPAAGGIRTQHHADLVSAVKQAAELARAMTLKCAIAGLDAGGGKGVVLAHPGLDRRAAFAKLGEHVQQLGGCFRTAGDLGTSMDDLRAMATTCEYVHTEEGDLARSVARGLLKCLEAMCRVREREVAGLRVAVQGCGAIGAAVARAVAQRGMVPVLADVNHSRAQALATELGAEMWPAAGILGAPVDIVAPCAVGGVITKVSAAGVRAWGVCGAANNIIVDEEAERALMARRVWCVPDVIASAGAVVDGIGRTVMGLDDRTALVDRLGEIAEAVLREALETGEPASRVAARIADARIAARREAING